MSSPAVRRFGEFELNAARRELLRQGRPLVLGARAFDLLLVLVARHGEVVSKAELLAAVWPGLVVEENNLQVQVSTLRKLLGPNSITTVAGRGYQFVAALQADDPAAATQPAPGAAAAPLAAPGRALIFGREAELAEARQALQAGRLLTLVGIAGVGKTRLARALGEQAGPGAACWVDLAVLAPQPAAADMAPLAAAVASALALPADPRPPLDRLLQALPSPPPGGWPLLVLDNCEHVAAATAGLVARLRAAAPGWPMLATSQVPLRLPDEQLLRLQPLGLPGGDDLQQARGASAVALFVARAAAVVAGFALEAGNVGPVAEICRRLEGIPLALELAAARLPLLGITGLQQRLDERFRLLAARRGSGVARHQTLQAALDWTHSLLSEAEQRLLRRLGLFVGGFTASLVQQVAADGGADEWAVLDGLASLVDRSLVTSLPQPPGDTAEPRFTLLETVRDDARARLARAGETDAFALRHAEALAGLAERCGGTVGAARDAPLRRQLEAEHDNLRAALDWCVGHDPRLGLRIAAALIPFWRERGHHAEALQRCERLLASTDARGDAERRLPVLVGLGSMATERGDAAAVQAAGVAVLDGARLTGNRLRETHALALLAHAAVMRGQMAVARGHFEACLVLHREGGDARLVAEGLNNVASCWAVEGQPERAWPLLQEALPLARACGNRWSEAALLQTLGEVAWALRDLDAARQHLQEGLQLRRGLAHEFQLVMALMALAMLELQARRPAASAEALREALPICARHGFSGKATLGLICAAAWAVLQGRAELATLLLGSVQGRLATTAADLLPAESQVHQQALDESRRLLGAGPAEQEQGAWLRAWQRGQGLSEAEALARALAALDDPGPPDAG